LQSLKGTQKPLSKLLRHDLQMVDKSVSDSRHIATADASRINRAIENGVKRPSFIDSSLGLLRDFRFPAFKHAIIDHAKQKSAPDGVLALFEGLDGYIEYRDLYHLRKSLEENNPEKKMRYQLSESTRTGQDLRKRSAGVGTNEERREYPEVSPTAASDFICDRCGKAFQNQQDMLKHQQFETGSSKT
jgi:hypothetical protein